MDSLTLINHTLFYFDNSKKYTFPTWDLAARRLSLPWIIAAETFSSDMSHSLASRLKVADWNSGLTQNGAI